MSTLTLPHSMHRGFLIRVCSREQTTHPCAHVHEATFEESTKARTSATPPSTAASSIRFLPGPSPRASLETPSCLFLPVQTGSLHIAAAVAPSENSPSIGSNRGQTKVCSWCDLRGDGPGKNRIELAAVDG